MKRSFLLLLFVCFTIFSFSQQRALDSLSLIIKQAKNDTSVARSYVGLTEILYISKPDTMIPLCQKALDIISKSFDKANPAEKRSFLITKAAALNNIGYIYNERGDVGKALDYYHQSLKIYESNGDKEGMSSVLNNMGVIYKRQGDIPKALEYYNRSLKISEELNDKKSIANTLGNIAVIYQNRAVATDTSTKAGKLISDSLFRMSLTVFEKNLKIQRELGAKTSVAHTLNNIAFTHMDMDDLPAAEKFFNEALKLHRENGDLVGEAFALNYLGECYYRRQKYDPALEYALRSLEVAYRSKLPASVTNASELLSKIYQKQNKWQEAFKMQSLYVRMKDSTKNEKTRKAALKKQLQYQFEQKEEMLKAEQEKERAIAEEKHNKQNIIIWSTVAGMILVVIFAAFVFRTLRLTRKQNKIIEQQKVLVEENQKEMIASITYSKRLQDAILPPDDLVKKVFPESFILYKPKDIIAGDFYWMELVDKTVYIAVGDCTGHGVPGAMVSVVCSNALNRAVKEFNLRETGKILDKVTELVLETFEKSKSEVKDGMDISFLAINRKEKKIQWSGANNPLWYITAGGLYQLKGDKQPIGSYENRKPFTTHNFDLEAGAFFYLFTDGYADQFGGVHGKKYKNKPFNELILSMKDLAAEKQKEKLNDTFENWKGNLGQVDDVCVIGLRV